MSDTLKDWLDAPRAKAIARFPERKDTFTTSSGVQIDPVQVNQNPDYGASLGLPGTFLTRGVQPTMYRSRHWTMRQYADLEAKI